MTFLIQDRRCQKSTDLNSKECFFSNGAVKSIIKLNFYSIFEYGSKMNLTLYLPFF